MRIQDSGTEKVINWEHEEVANEKKEAEERRASMFCVFSVSLLPEHFTTSP